MPSGPFPRQYEIQTTLHLRQRSEQRDIPLEIVLETIRTGSERPLAGRGVKKGIRFEFRKVRAGRIVVVIAEIVDNRCFVLTTYHEDQ